MPAEDSSTSPKKLPINTGIRDLPLDLLVLGDKGNDSNADDDDVLR
jgi:hypothetical protein